MYIWIRIGTGSILLRVKLGANSAASTPYVVVDVQVRSLFPRLVNSLTAKDLSLLQQDHITPLRLIDSVNKATRLDTEASALGVGGVTIDRGHIDVLPCIELESGLSAVDLEVEAREGVAELAQQAEGL